MKRRRRQFAGNLVHVWDHQQEALRRGKRRRQGAGLQGTVDSACRATLALHFHHAGHRAPDIRNTFRGPLVGPFAHVG